MIVAVVLYMVHRWATNQTAVNPKIVIESLFAIVVVSMLDQGRTENIARGFAWLFVVAAAYNAIPDLTKATKAKSASTTSPAASQPTIV